MIRYKGLGYVALTVTDLERARRWYPAIAGVQESGIGPSGEVFYCAGGTRHHDLVLYQGAKPALRRIGWELESEAQVPVVKAQLDRHGVAWRELGAAECESIGMHDTIRAIDPVTGVTLDFYARMREAARPFVPGVARLENICHVGVGTPRYREAIRFYEEVLNFRTSDEIDGRINLMRCFPNPLHHSFALAAAERNTLHHLNIMVAGPEDMAAARERFRANGVPIVWDGHHPPSQNTFLFYLDPDGLSLEIGHGMELFPEVGARAARVFPPKPESFDSTGAHRDERTAAVGEIEPLTAP